MTGGYVALLDILGFSALVSADNTGGRIRRYLECLQGLTGQRKIDCVVFSDSIVLTCKGDDAEPLCTLAGACSRLFSDLLEEQIALRGAIAFGDFFRSAVGESVFVAGRAIVEAYAFERAQDWVGIMLTPSALARIPDLPKRCELRCTQIGGNPTQVDPWAAVIQPCHSIPFHSSLPASTASFDGFAIVPTNGYIDQPVALSYHLSESVIPRLKWLRALAPDPDCQRKYQRTIEWLQGIETSWDELSGH